MVEEPELSRKSSRFSTRLVISSFFVGVRFGVGPSRWGEGFSKVRRDSRNTQTASGHRDNHPRAAWLFEDAEPSFSKAVTDGFRAPSKELQLETDVVSVLKGSKRTRVQRSTLACVLSAWAGEIGLMNISRKLPWLSKSMGEL